MQASPTRLCNEALNKLLTSFKRWIIQKIAQRAANGNVSNKVFTGFQHASNFKQRKHSPSDTTCEFARLRSTKITSPKLTKQILISVSSDFKRDKHRSKFNQVISGVKDQTHLNKF
jgi:hypothetical protein